MMMMVLRFCAASCIDLLHEGCAACSTAHPLLVVMQVVRQVNAACTAAGCCDAATPSPSTLCLHPRALSDAKSDVSSDNECMLCHCRPGIARSNSKVGSGGGFLPRIGSRPASPGNDGSMGDVVVGSAHAAAGGQGGQQEGSSSRQGSQAGSLAGFPASRSRPGSPSLPAGLMKPPVFVEE